MTRKDLNSVACAALVWVLWISSSLFLEYSYSQSNTVLSGVVLDILKTVPFRIIYQRGSYSLFFGAPLFFATIVTCYFMMLFSRNYWIKSVEV